MKVAGKTVLITGGGGGIGAGLAEAFAEQGARVAVTDINRDYAEAEAARIGRGVIALAHDVTSLESWAEVAAAVEAEFGPVDVLCNNAGVAQSFKPLIEIEPGEFARILAINVTGVYNGIKTFAATMQARGEGHIVNTSSVNGLLPHATFAAYTASKFAVTGLSEALRMELAPHGVGVSILYPGLTRSRMSESQVPGMSAEAQAALRARMMEPVWLGRAVVRAVEANELHVVTHPDHRETIEARMAALYAAHGEPAQPGFNGGSFAIE
jgi:NAD(P)-dependent dehydrogenase (short-subunit alcohol dehydrogenase family)